MHAFLLIGTDSEKLKAKSEELAKKLHAKIMEFPLLKIEDVRNLNNLIRLSFDKPTLIVCRNIHEAGEEALNAFLKNLEEPSENVFFALTASSARKVLPTITSRCQIVKVQSVEKVSLPEDKAESTEIEDFFKLSAGEKLFYIGKIKDRGMAIEFAGNAIAFMHQTLHSDRSLHENRLKYTVKTENIELALKTLSRLKANGNVNLQLSNLVIHLNY
jgi:DNA polymerase III delta prime subunit